MRYLTNTAMVQGQYHTRPGIQTWFNIPAR